VYMMCVEGGGTIVVLDDSLDKTDLEQKIKDSLSATDVLLVSSHGPCRA